VPARRPGKRLERDAVYQRFYALIDSIPRGRVTTYGQIAR
jgi:alkylated DNA nucleotide flippase Atl1